MSDFRKQVLGKNLYLLLVAAGLFALAYLFNRYIADPGATHYYARQIEKNIQQKEADFRRLSEDTALLGSLVDQTYPTAVMEKLLYREKDYCFFISEGEARDSSEEPRLVFWNTQVVVPPVNSPQQPDSAQLIKLDNGWYIYIRRETNFRPGRHLMIEALIPVMWKYFVENENLKQQFVSFPAAGQWVDLASKPTGYPVKNESGGILFYLQKAHHGQHTDNIPVVLLIVTGTFLAFIFIHQAAHYLAERYNVWVGTGVLAGILVLLRIATYFLPGLFNLRQFELFDPTIYGSSFVLSSLGDLFINAILFCWIALFFSRRVSLGRIVPFRDGWKNWTLVSVLAIALVVVTFLFSGIVQSLVADAKIPFNVTNISSLNRYTFVGFAILAFMALSYFFLSQLLVQTIAIIVDKKNAFFLYIILAFAGLLALTVSSNNSVVELNLYVLIWLLLYTWLIQRKLFSGIYLRLNISEVLFWLFVFSFSISSVIIFENRKLEFDQRKRFADRLGSQADPTSERELSIALAYLDNSYLGPNFRRFKNPVQNRTLKENIINRNFSPYYVNKYDTRIYTFDDSTRPLYNVDPVSYDTLNTIFSIQGKETSITGLRYFEKSFDKFAYIFKRQVYNTSGALMGYFFVLSEPKEYKSDALYPELFKQSRGEYFPAYSPDYYYAIYNNLELIDHYNDYPFPTHLSPDEVPKNEFRHKREGAYDELWYKRSLDKVVIIIKKDNSFIEAITLFAYLFSTFLFLLALYRLLSQAIRSRFRFRAFRHLLQLSIRSQIHGTIIMVSLLSFLVIGVSTILFFINRYNRSNEDQLSRTMSVMNQEVRNELKRNAHYYDSLIVAQQGPNEEMEKLVEEVAEIHGTDVNLYDTRGNLLVASNPFIYNKGVLSGKMDPVAYYYMHNLQAVQKITEEKIGKLKYQSVYSPIRDGQGTAFAYLNIPSYRTQSELQQEISNFFVTLINLNAFIFLVAGAIALFITNRITSSFTLIGEKMRDIKLNKLNQEIEWNRNDEIGELVAEYNRMVKQLEESAEALAKSEREGAWRQMARQVAHEIKNPLTPMKLSIQYLQKAIDNNSANVKEMTANVAKTLIEQIDHLSRIASDFSQFANIGNPKKEVFDLHEMLGSLSALYSATENVDYEWQPLSQRVMLFADKTQLNRLFTNLLQNAVESGDGELRRVIRVEEHLNGEYITVSIRDNGEGIPEDMRSKIFMPNFTTKSSGTGLGLAMSKSIAQQAQGDIWFETQPGEGTTFFVKLPLLRVTD